MSDCCGTCKYWRMEECRKHAPQFVVVQWEQDGRINENVVVRFPYTNYDCWCGEFEPKILTEEKEK